MGISFLPLAQQSSAGSLQQTIDNLARTPLSDVLKFVVVLTVIRFAISFYLKNTPVHLRSGAYPLARFVNELSDAFIYAGIFVFMVIRPFAVQAFLIPSGSMWPTLYVNDFIVANKAIYRFSDPHVGDIVVFRPPKEAIFDPSQIDAEGEVKVDFIKRCQGTPGDLVELRDGIMYRNGKRDEETAYKHYSECMDQNRNNCVNFRALNPEEIDALTKASFKLVKYNGEIIPFNWTKFDANAQIPGTSRYGEGPPYGVAGKFVITDPAVATQLIQAPAEKVPPGYYLMMGDNRNGSFDSRGWGLVPREAIVGRSEAIWLPLSRWRATR